MSGTVTINVFKDGWTNGFQLSIDDDDGGFRLAGPKFNGSSQLVISHALNSLRDIEEIESYCKRARAALTGETGGAL